MEVREHELWKLLLQKIEEEDKSIESSLKEGVWKICEYGIDLSKTIRDTFHTYTLHDEVHICNVMTKMLELLGELKHELTRDECALLIMAACCHDIGMSVTEEEKEYLRGCPDCMQTYLESHPKEYRLAYEQGIHEKADITDEILQRYVRANHHKRVREQLQNVEWPEVLGRFMSVDELIAVCESHGEDAKTTGYLYNFSPKLDLHLCAVLLRLGDILDFDATRASDTIYRYINLAHLEGMENEKSCLEWKKHQSSRGFAMVQDERRTLLYRAECTCIQVEQAIVSYLNWVDEELSSCGKLIRSMAPRWQTLLLPGKVERQITARGYLSGEYKLTLDQDRVLDLLVGKELYSDPAVFVRELIQNAIDAVRTRKEMDKELPKNWRPQINIRTWVDDEGYNWFRIEDNGIGMTEKSICDYFLKVGHSYYNSDQFQTDKIRCGVSRDYQPISRFGIGILSCFMSNPKDNRVEVATKHFRENGERYPSYRLSLQGINGYYYLANDNEHRKIAHQMPNYPKGEQAFLSEPGTIIAVRTNLYQSGGAHSFKDIIDKYVIYPEVPIHYEGIEGTYDYKTEQEFMNAVHELMPKTEDGVYPPVERIPIPEDEIQALQRKYPEIVWEERPSIAVYCLPLDYFIDTPLIKGATIIAVAEGKGVWKAEGLDEKYVPKLRLEMFHDIDENESYIISFYLKIFDQDDLEERILPMIQSKLPFQELNDVSAKELRVYQVINSNKFTEVYQTIQFKSFSWYQNWFRQLGKVNAFNNNIVVNSHNGIFIDNSNTLFLDAGHVSRTLLILKDAYCPKLDLSRNAIKGLPLEASCYLDVLVAQMEKSLVTLARGRYDNGRLLNSKNRAIAVKDYWEVLEHSPYLSSGLDFLTDMGKVSLEDIKRTLQSQDKVRINRIYIDFDVSNGFYLAVLMKYLDLKVHYSNDGRVSVYAVKKMKPSVMEELSMFPSGLFLPLTTDDVSILSIMIDGIYTAVRSYNSNHPFAKWLIRNQSILQNTVTGIYNQIIEYLMSEENLIENINKTLERLRQVPHLGIKIAENLTIDDFIVVQNEE